MKRIYILAILLVSNVSVFSQESPNLTPSLELFIRTKNTNGISITFETIAMSSVVWDQRRYITNDPEFTQPKDIIIRGDITGCVEGWNSDGVDGTHPSLGRANYEVRVKGKSAKLTIKALGTSFTGDKHIIYDALNDKFIYAYSDCNEEIGDISSLTLYTDKDGLQPTPPLSLSVQNQNDHPYLTWQEPDDPLGRDYFTYSVYRKKDNWSFVRLASNLADTNFLDDEIFLEYPAATYTYYVTAKTSSSPESNPSNEVSVQGAKGKIARRKFNTETFPHSFLLENAFPNPFYSKTQIKFELANESKIDISIFDIQGRLVKNIFTGIKPKGKYDFVWNGTNDKGRKISAGIYLVVLSGKTYHGVAFVRRQKVILVR